jgi:hypothetical protein
MIQKVLNDEGIGGRTMLPVFSGFRVQDLGFRIQGAGSRTEIRPHVFSRFRV